VSRYRGSLRTPYARAWDVHGTRSNYHKGAVAKATFAKVDHEIWKTLWQWARRRHPNKTAPWTKERYFKSIGNRNWVFAANVTTPDGNPQHPMWGVILDKMNHFVQCSKTCPSIGKASSVSQPPNSRQNDINLQTAADFFCRSLRKG
jgi:hypothetical protein